MLFERPEIGQRALIVHVEVRNQPNPDLAEFAELARSAQLEVVSQECVKRDAPHARWFVGSGKVEELETAVRAHRAQLVLINHELSAGQSRNLEKALDCRIMTRTELILMIFADRARSHEGQLQVELAQLKHAQTRLVRGWTHLDRQKGGIGLRGAGEKQIELDQRMLGGRIKAVEGKLAQVAKRRGQGRRGRQRKGTPTVVLAGYTNAGKSTLFNALTDAEVLAEDMLFATLDPTMRRADIPGTGEVVLADTVGFVSQLPHALVDAFKATLEEVASADLLLHVVDGADPLAPERISQVREVLAEIGAEAVPEIVVYNKIDLLDGAEPAALRERCSRGQSCAVSAVTHEGFDDLKAAIATALGVVAPHCVRLDPGDGETRAWLYRSGAVLKEEMTGGGEIELMLQADEPLLENLKARLGPAAVLRVDQSVPKLSLSTDA